MALLVLVIVIALPLYYFFQVQPTCFDTKQDGDETGVDCGGSCTTLCSSQSLPLIAKGDPRVLRVSTSTYEVVAYVQNPNAIGVVVHASYTFKLYEASSTIPVKTINASVYVPKNATFAVFEGPFDLGDKRPTRATFEWDLSSLDWTSDPDPTPDIFITNDGVKFSSTTPRIDAVVKNRSLQSVSNLYLVALVFDNTGTIAAASKTYIDDLASNMSVPVSLTWPGSFSFTPASVVIIPIVLPDASYIH